MRWMPALLLFLKTRSTSVSCLSNFNVAPAGVRIKSQLRDTAASEQFENEAAPEELFADDDEEGWEGMEDLAPAAEAASSAAAAKGHDSEGWEESESLAPAEAAADAFVAEGDDAEGWEEPEDLASANAADVAEGDAAAEEAVQSTDRELEEAAAGEAEAAVDMHQVGFD